VASGQTFMKNDYKCTKHATRQEMAEVDPPFSQLFPAFPAFPAGWRSWETG